MMAATQREHRYAKDAGRMRQRSFLERLIRVARRDRGDVGGDAFARGMIAGATILAVVSDATKDYRRLVEMWRRS